MSMVVQLEETRRARTEDSNQIVIDPCDIEVVSGFNVRKDAEPEEELVESVKHNGVLMPIHVRHLMGNTGKFFLIDGHRRVNAAKKAGLKTIRAVNHGPLDDADAYLIALVANNNQKKLSKKEQYDGIRRLSNLGFSEEKISQALVLDVRTVTEIVRVQKKGISALKKAAKKSVKEGGVNPRAAARAATLPKKEQEKLVPKMAGKPKEEAIAEVRKVERKLGMEESRRGPKPKAKAFQPKRAYLLAEDATDRCQQMETAIRAKLRKAPSHPVLCGQLLIIQCLKGEIAPTDLFGWDHV